MRAESWSASKRAPARFWPGKLLDGSEKTVSCFDVAALPSSFTIGFTAPSRAREIRVVNGDGRSKAAFRRSARVAKLTLIESTYVREVRLEDSPEPQTIRLQPPLSEDRVTIRIDAVHGEGARVCLSELRFVARGKVLRLAAKGTPRWQGLVSRVLGLWMAGPPGAPEKFLTLSFDGRYRFAYRPNDPEAKGSTHRGRWSLRGGILRLSGAGAPARLRLRLTTEEDDLGERHRVLEIRGKARGQRAHLPDRYQAL